jgi:hypothetical protein
MDQLASLENTRDLLSNELAEISSANAELRLQLGTLPALQAQLANLTKRHTSVLPSLSHRSIGCGLHAARGCQYSMVTLCSVACLPFRLQFIAPLV